MTAYMQQHWTFTILLGNPLKIVHLGQNHKSLIKAIIIAVMAYNLVSHSLIILCLCCYAESLKEQL